MAKSNRYFRHDVFLSHNQKDGSLVLRDELIKLGVAAWHDGDSDMSNKNVFSVVQNALNESRFICVCVRHGFRDSDWVRAEYWRGLELTRKSGACCVIIAEMTPEAVVPQSLRGQPRFRLYAEGLAPLAAYLRAANHRQPIDGEYLVPSADELRRDAVKLRSHNPSNTSGSLLGISDDERAKLLLANLRSKPGDGQMPAYALTQILGLASSIKNRQVLLDIYAQVMPRDDILAEAARSEGEDQHRPLEVLLHPLSELAREPAYSTQACDLHDKILARVAAIHNLSPKLVDLFQRYHSERLAGRWVDTRRPQPKSLRRNGMSFGDFAIMLLGWLVLLAGVGILFLMLNTG